MVSMDIWKSPSMAYKHDKVALRITCIKLSNLRLSKYGEVVNM